MKESFFKFIQKYHITKWKIVVLSVLFLLFVLRFLIQGNVLIKPVLFVFDLYANILILNTKLILYFLNQHLIFDFTGNQIINNEAILNIDRFYFSINQIVSTFIIVLITKSPVLNKIKSFLLVFLILTVYNSIRISFHAIYPHTISVHNWAFNLVLIPRWLIVILFVKFYWKQFPELKEKIKRKLGFSEKLMQLTFVKIAVLIVIYQLVVIIAFNNFFIINGDLLISFVLKTSKLFIDWMGYDCWINYRLIYGNNASLYMDDACLGIDLMFLFASFIYVIPGSEKHKIWYIPMGLFIIILLNCVRVILIFINLSKNSTYNIPLEIHDLFTYPVLVLTLFLWIIWVNKFVKLKLDSSK